MLFRNISLQSLMGINSCGNTGHSIPIQVLSRFHSKSHDVFNSCPLPMEFPFLLGMNSHYYWECHSHDHLQCEPHTPGLTGQISFKQHLFWFWLNSDSAKQATRHQSSVYLCTVQTLQLSYCIMCIFTANFLRAHSFISPVFFCILRNFRAYP